MLGLLLGPVLLVGCGRTSQPAGDAPPAAPFASAPVRGGEATAATAIDLEVVNELIDNGNDLTSEVVHQLFAKLAYENPDFATQPPTFRPGLAERWEWSPDHRSLTFHLRQGATWSDGTAITADDVRFTWEAQRSPEVGWIYAEIKEAIRDVEVVDAATVRFHFDRVYTAMFHEAVEGVILPKHAWSALPFAEWRQRPEWFAENLVVSGPFTLGPRQPGQQLTLLRNPRHYDQERPRLDALHFRVLPDKPSQLLAIESGAIDFVSGVPAGEADRLAANADVALHRVWARHFEYLAWNVENPLFADPNVRRALTLAIDRQAIVDTVWRGNARIGFSPFLARTWATNQALAPLPYDPAEATRLLAAAGWRDADGDGVLDRDGRPFRFALVTNTGNQPRADTQVLIQAQLAKVGVAVEPRLVEGATLTGDLIAHRFDATIGGWAIDTTMNARYYFHSEEAEGGYNFGAYRNPELDRLLVAATEQPDPATAKPILDQIQEILHRDQPYTFLVEPQRLHASRQRLQGVTPDALFVFGSVADWWVRP
jgi:peptide/nickel transport system substrate-binding protein